MPNQTTRGNTGPLLLTGPKKGGLGSGPQLFWYLRSFPNREPVTLSSPPRCLC